MSQINALTGAIAQGTQIKQTQSASRDRQIRRTQNLGKNSALTGDELEHQVESSDALHGINDRNDSYQPQKRRQGKNKSSSPKTSGGDSEEHIDVKA